MRSEKKMYFSYFLKIYVFAAECIRRGGVEVQMVGVASNGDTNFHNSSFRPSPELSVGAIEPHKCGDAHKQVPKA